MVNIFSRGLGLTWTRYPLLFNVANGEGSWELNIQSIAPGRLRRNHLKYTATGFTSLYVSYEVIPFFTAGDAVMLVGAICVVLQGSGFPRL